ncbi:alkaline phosphatase family protein, partial [Streptomyces sp. EKS3.2]|uniref:alkaline phosphatase family protein n=1 Tax=Streptomyces sp. EKS3.2 TaxID=3461008 RepID=UPI00404305C8
GADLVSSQWIIDATRHIMHTRHPDLTLCYLPHLDYDLQRYGPDDPRSHKAATDLDTALAPLLDDARTEGRTVVALSEYGITPVSRPVDINRALRRAGLLEVHTQDGMEYLDPMASRAFAVAD